MESKLARPKARKGTNAQTANVVAFLLPLAFVLGLGLGYLLWGRSASATADSPDTQQAAAEIDPSQVRRYDVPPDDDPSLGPADAQITIVEFSDYECPYCTKWHNEVWPKIQAAYPDSVRLVYRDFPLSSIHGNAAPAAEAANCAGEQNAYWQYHALLFESKYGLGDQAYEQYASELSLDAAAFTECLSSRRYQDEVVADYEFATSIGIQSTPTFFINGIAVIGAQPFESFQKIIDLELAGKIPE